jgi:hypothetical protein
MPFAGEHDAPLHLLTGVDPLLTLLWRLLALLGTVALLTETGSDPWFRFALLMVFSAALAGLEWRQARAPSRRVVIFPDGRCEIDGNPGILAPAAWLSRRYCVLGCRCGRRSRRLLISASRQKSGEYRKLLGWMRLQPWDTP